MSLREIKFRNNLLTQFNILVYTAIFRYIFLYIHIVKN
jgi:hypothetical protein